MFEVIFKMVSFTYSDYQAQMTFTQWKQKRRQTMIAMLLVNLVGGMDISIILATIVPYLRYTIIVQDVNAFYAFITTAFCVSSAVFGIISGKLVDRTRQMKIFTSITLLLQVVGNLVYTIPISSAFPLVGRLLAGAGESFTGVCIGEVIRIYDTKGSNRIICWLAMMSSFGYVIGPVISIPLSKCHFKIYELRIDGYNIAGVLIAILCSLTFMLCQFMMHDCSKIFDMKSHLAEQGLEDEPESIEDEFFINNNNNEVLCHEETSSSEDEDENIAKEEESLLPQNSKSKHSNPFCFAKDEESLLPQNSKSKLSNPFCFAKDKESLLPQNSKSKLSNPFYFVRTFDQWMVLVYSFIMMFIIASGESLIPLINYEVMNWSLNTLVIIFVGYGIVLLATSMLLSKICTGDESIYRVGYASFPCVITFYLALLLMSLDIRNKNRDIFYMFLFVLSLVFIWFMESIAMRSMFGRMVPSELQSFAEALRAAVSRFGMVVSSFVSPFLLSVLMYYSSCFLVVGVIMLVVYIARRKQLTDIQFTKL
eukprot:TCONS_00058296-protein